MGAAEEGKDQDQRPADMEAGCSFRIAETEHVQSSGPTIAETGRMPTWPPRDWICPGLGPFSKAYNFCFQMVRMALLLLPPLWLLPLTGGSQRAEPMFTAVTNSVLPPDYDSNPTQLNYGVAVTDVDHDGDFEIVVAG